MELKCSLKFGMWIEMIEINSFILLKFKGFLFNDRLINIPFNTGIQPDKKDLDQLQDFNTEEQR